MLRLATIFILIIFIGCVAYKKYSRQDILEQKFDTNGRLVFKKYRQLMSNPSGDKLATIKDEFDTLGRIIKSSGFDDPYTYNKKFFIQKTYIGTHLYLINKIIWNKNDSLMGLTDFESRLFNDDVYLFEENIYPDSSSRLKKIRISLSPEGNAIYYGQYEETFPDSQHSLTTKYYDFTINETNIRFSKDSKLVLDSISKKY
jgi:hypothetical protein